MTRTLCISFSGLWLASCGGAEPVQTERASCAGVEPEAATFKLMTINIRHDRDEWERRFPLIADEIVRLAPDVIGMQEVEIGSQQADVLQRLIAERLPAHVSPYHVFERLKYGESAVRGEGIAIFSRVPFIATEAVDIGFDRPLLFARVSLTSRFTIDVYDTHLYEKEEDERRLQQVEAALGFIASHEQHFPTFLVGDLNSDADSPAVHRLEGAGFEDSFRNAHHGHVDATSMTSWSTPATDASQRPDRRIDFIFVGHTPLQRGRTRVVSSVVCFDRPASSDIFPSDHLGVMTTFELIQ